MVPVLCVYFSSAEIWGGGLVDSKSTRGFQAQMRRRICVRGGMSRGVGKGVESDARKPFWGRKKVSK